MIIVSMKKVKDRCKHQLEISTTYTIYTVTNIYMRYIHTHKRKGIKSLRLCTGKVFRVYLLSYSLPYSVFTNVSIEM